MYNNEGQAWEILLKAISLSCHSYKVNEQHNGNWICLKTQPTHIAKGSLFDRQ